MPAFIPTEPPPPAILVTQSAAFPWDLPYVWEEQKELGWPSEIAEADDPLTVFIAMATKGRGFYDPLALLEDDERPTWRNVLNAVLRRPGAYKIDDYIEVLNFIRGLRKDPADSHWWGKKDLASILEDARALRAILARHDARRYTPPLPTQKPGAKPDISSQVWWEEMAEMEAAHEKTREEIHHLALQNDYPDTYNSLLPGERVAALDRYRKSLERARKRLQG